MLQFIRNRDGNVAMMFGLLAIPLLVAAGVSIDLLRSSQVKTELAEAADAGVLAAARAKLLNSTLTKQEAEEIATRTFEANRKARSTLSLTSLEFDFNDNTNTFSFEIVGTLETAIMGIVGQDTTPVNILTEATVAPPRVLEAVLVLDTTHSMEGAKLAALKTAATDLVDILMKDNNNKTKVGIVPFSNHVNVGLSRKNEPWLDVPADRTENICTDTYSDPSACRQETQTCNKDGISASCQRTVCDDSADVVQSCSEVTLEWEGCVGSRNAPLNVEDRAYNIGTRVPGLLDVNCPEELLPLTDVKSQVVSKIDGLTTGGSTYIAPGLTWGLRLISNAVPFTEGVTFEQMEDSQGTKALILMTDGANTRSAQIPTSPSHKAANIADADDTLIAVCDEAKNEEIVIYTIAFEVSDDNIKDQLRNCATSPEDFFNAGDSAALTTAFSSIANQLTELALSK